MKVDISKTLKGKKVMFIARDGTGSVRFRADTLEKLNETIKNYKPPTKPESEELADTKPKRKGFSLKTVSEEEKIKVENVKNSEETTVTNEKPEEKKGFLQSETKEIIETKRKSSGKKTFWDKLK